MKSYAQSSAFEVLYYLLNTHKSKTFDLIKTHKLYAVPFTASHKKHFVIEWITLQNSAVNLQLMNIFDHISKKSHAEILFVAWKVSVAKLVLQVAVTQRIYLLPGNCASIDTLQIRAAFFLLLSH